MFCVKSHHKITRCGSKHWSIGTIHFVISGEKPGLTRNMEIGSEIVIEVAVFNKESYLTRILYDQYCMHVLEENKIGRHSFLELVSVLCQPGTYRKGLSTYYIGYRFLD